MIEDRERAVAYVTGRIVSTSRARLIREDATGSLMLLPGDVSRDRVHVYDFQIKGYVSGTSSAGRWNLFGPSASGISPLTVLATLTLNCRHRPWAGVWMRGVTKGGT